MKSNDRTTLAERILVPFLLSYFPNSNIGYDNNASSGAFNKEPFVSIKLQDSSPVMYNVKKSYFEVTLLLPMSLRFRCRCLCVAVALPLRCRSLCFIVITSNPTLNRPYSYSQYWAGTSSQWRLMRGNLF